MFMALRGVYGLSMSYFSPNGDTLRSALRMLVKSGLVEEAGRELGKASGFERKLYKITTRGMLELHSQRQGLMMAVRAIDRAEARRFIEVGGWRRARRG